MQRSLSDFNARFANLDREHAHALGVWSDNTRRQFDALYWQKLEDIHLSFNNAHTQAQENADYIMKKRVKALGEVESAMSRFKSQLQRLRR
jgi:hypothetical protein